MKVIIALVLFFSWLTSFASSPCKDVKCDSTVVRAILDANGLTDVPVKEVVKINGFPRIYVLNFSERSISQLPEDIGNLTNLSSLYLDYNNLTQLPETIGRLQNLESLTLNNNQLSNLPEALFGLKTSFNINNNHFCDVSEDEFERLTIKSFFDDWNETQECRTHQASGVEAHKVSTTEQLPSTQETVEEEAPSLTE